MLTFLFAVFRVWDVRSGRSIHKLKGHKVILFYKGLFIYFREWSPKRFNVAISYTHTYNATYLFIYLFSNTTCPLYFRIFGWEVRRRWYKNFLWVS